MAVADSLRNLSIILGGEGKWDQAYDNAKQVLAMRRKLLDLNHPEIASALEDVAWAASGIVVAPIIVRFGFRRTAVVGSLITSLSFTGLFLCALLKAHGVVLAAVLMASGLGFGARAYSTGSKSTDLSRALSN